MLRNTRRLTLPLILFIAGYATPAKETGGREPGQSAHIISSIPEASSKNQQEKARDSIRPKKTSRPTAKRPERTKKSESKKSSVGVEKETKRDNAKPKVSAQIPQPSKRPVALEKPDGTCHGAQPPPKLTREQVYEGAVFQPGEKAEYEISYYGIHAGNGFMAVRPPIRHKGVWHRVFQAEGSTGDWFEAILLVRVKTRAVSRPWDFGISKFYLERYRKKMFGSPESRIKWIDFDHSSCRTYEKARRTGEQEKKNSFELKPGAIDVMGALYYLRMQEFKVGKLVTAPVYSSKKNWILEANPIAIERVSVPAGTFNAVKLKLQTYLGQALQQKGDAYMWLAVDRPEHPMVQIEAKIKIGSISVRLSRFTTGH